MIGVTGLETPVPRIIGTKGAGTKSEVMEETTEVALGVATVVARAAVAVNRWGCRDLVKRSAGLDVGLRFRVALDGKSTIGWISVGN